MNRYDFTTMPVAEYVDALDVADVDVDDLVGTDAEPFSEQAHEDAQVSALADVIAKWFRTAATDAWIRAGADTDALAAKLALHVIDEVV